MPTIKDALDIIGKLTVAEQESLKTMLLRGLPKINSGSDQCRSLQIINRTMSV